MARTTHFTSSILWLMLIVTTAPAADKGGGVDPALWAWTTEAPRPPRVDKNGPKPQPPAIGYLWLPDNVKQIRGLLVGGRTLLEKRLCQDSQIRDALAKEQMGTLYFDPALDSLFDFVQRDSGKILEKALADLASKSNHPEIEFAPMLTVGHSTGGIFCRNVAYWKPERVIGVLHLMSGNLQDHIPDPTRSLAGVPFLAINGEFEEYGPAGGDLKGGLRREYSLHPEDKTKQNQTQWIIVRQQLLDRRRRNPENLMGLIVHRGKSHTSWSDDMTALTVQFIHSAAKARLPSDPGAKSPAPCKTVRAQDGWLTDPDLKSPHHPPARYNQYEGDRSLAFWYPDEAMARAVARYHEPQWDIPDPTAGQPEEKRFTPPEALRDKVDVHP